MNLTVYEQKALREIDEWEMAQPGLAIKAMDIAGRPVSIILEKVPHPLRGTVERAVIGFMEMLRDISFWTYSNKRIVNKGKKRGLKISDIQHLAHQDLEDLDRLARRHFMSGKIIAALEGAGCGLGGLAMIAVDIPVLMGIIFRSIQQIGTCYGFPMQDPSMLPVVMNIYNAGSSDSASVKSAVLADMQLAAAAMTGKTAYAKAAAKSKTSMALKFLESSAGSLPSRIAENISKRKLGQLIPVAGALIGAGFNYWLMSSTMTAAYMIFRKMHIERRHAGEREHHDDKPSISTGKRRFKFLRLR